MAQVDLRMLSATRPRSLTKTKPPSLNQEGDGGEFGKAFTVEAVRGCNRGCRFCLIGHIGRPKRERSLSRLEEIVDEGLRSTPVKKVSLIGADLSEHSNLEDLCELVVSRGLELSIPSVRPETVTEHLAKTLVNGKQRRVSMAPDGSSPRSARS